MSRNLRINNIPCSCYVSQRKKFYFNLNNYRNAHYQVLNKVKRWFLEWFMLNNQRTKAIIYPIKIHYKIWLRKRSDMMNVGTVVDKFLQDAMVHKRIIPDDNADVVKLVIFEFAGYDKNPHVDAEISRYEEEK